MDNDYTVLTLSTLYRGDGNLTNSIAERCSPASVGLAQARPNEVGLIGASERYQAVSLLPCGLGTRLHTIKTKSQRNMFICILDVASTAE